MATPKNQLTLAKAQEAFFYDDSDVLLEVRPSNKVTWERKLETYIKLLVTVK